MQADAGVEGERVDGPPRPLDAGVEGLDAVVGGEVGADRVDARAERLDLAGGAIELGVLGAEDEVEPVLGELLGELEADAAGAAGDDGEGARGFHDEGGRESGKNQSRAAGWPSVVGTSPVSITCLNRRTSSFTICSETGSSSFPKARPAAPTGGR